MSPISSVSPRFSGAVLDIPLSLRESDEALTLPQLSTLTDYLERRRGGYGEAHEVHIYEQAPAEEGGKPSVKAAITSRESSGDLEVLKALRERASQLSVKVLGGTKLALENYTDQPRLSCLMSQDRQVNREVAAAQAMVRLDELA